MTAPAPDPPRCWCGSSLLNPFAPQYLLCLQCGTLVYAGGPPRPELYSESYWYERQREVHGLPTLPERAREDLYLRCPSWLRLVLAWKLPPARVLEAGAAHGGFVACLRWAGFEASGLEMNEPVADWARQAFRVPMQVGAVERQGLPPASLDVVCLFDVLEHLPDPEATLRECRRILRPDGLLLLQTPERPADRAAEALSAARHPFLRMLIPEEHLFLFTRNSVDELLRRTGFGWSVPQPTLSPEFNMTLAASAAPLREWTPDEQRAALEAAPGGRLVAALLSLEAGFTAADADRRNRLAIIESVDAQLRAAEAEKARLDAGWRKAEEQLRAAEAERSRLDAASRQAEERLRAGEIEKARLDTGWRKAEEQLRAAVAERARLDTGWRKAEEQLRAAVAERARLDAVSRKAEQQLRAAEVEKARLDAGWRKAEEQLRAVVARPPKQPAPPKAPALRRVAIDCGPMLAGGENGGAKPLALSQIEHMAALRPDVEFVLLAYERAFPDLSRIGLPNLRLQNLEQNEGLLRRLMPSRAGGSLLARLQADVLFCPFTEPVYADAHIPCLSVVHDLQFASYPEFFPEPVRAERDRHIRDAVSRSRRILCGTAFVRQSLIDRYGVDPHRIHVIPHSVPDRLPRLARDEARDLLAGVPGAAHPYFLYPANFWPHKNHRLLLTAYGLYRAAGGSWNLILTGAPGEGRDAIAEAVAAFGWTEAVFLPGYLDDRVFAALLASASALLYPSLYEGFGMPLVEAMRLDVPIACADATCLPEVAGGAAHLFDPRRPESIASAMHTMENDSALRAGLVERGRVRAASLGDARRMAARVLAEIEAALTGNTPLADSLAGVHADGWTGETVIVSWARRPAAASLEIEIEAAPPAGGVRLDGWPSGHIVLEQGTRATLSTPLDPDGGHLELRLYPAFVPDRFDGKGDTRRLVARWLRGRIVDSQGSAELKPGAGGPA